MLIMLIIMLNIFLLLRESIKQHSRGFSEVSKLYGSGALTGLRNRPNLLCFALPPTE